MAVHEPMAPEVDPISLEVLRTRLDAISDESAATIERTAISPVVTESKDYSATVLDGDGNLVTGGGRIEYHFGAAMNAVRSTIARPFTSGVPAVTPA